MQYDITWDIVEARRMLGYHAKGADKSTPTYSRDDAQHGIWGMSYKQ